MSEFPNWIDMSQKDINQYSLHKMIEATFSGKWSDAPLEHEISQTIEKRVGKAPRGAYVPLDLFVSARKMEQQRLEHFYSKHRALQHRVPPMDTTENVHLVGTQQLASQFIDALRPSSVALQMGAVAIPGLVQNVSIPKVSTSANFEWLLEDQNVSADSELTTESLLMSPHTIASAVPYSRKLRQQSLPSIDTILLNDLTAGAAVGIDAAVLNGTGAGGQPLGILNQSILTETITPAGQPDWSNLVNMEVQVLSQNISPSASTGYVTTPAVSGFMKTTEKSTGYPVFLQEGNEVNGYPCLPTTQMPLNGILFGDWSQCLIGFWGTLDVLMDWATKAASGGMVMRVFQDCDTVLRYPESFCKNA